MVKDTARTIGYSKTGKTMTHHSLSSPLQPPPPPPPLSLSYSAGALTGVVMDISRWLETRAISVE